mmetsp:Transcript_43747/g.140297  ORF Transcript_43747/g.140297 Transcript_43747/m.140297 type:complete len:232 (-) Transcript_43747:966-1661(-)
MLWLACSHMSTSPCSKLYTCPWASVPLLGPLLPTPCGPLPRGCGAMRGASGRGRRLCGWSLLAGPRAARRRRPRRPRRQARAATKRPATAPQRRRRKRPLAEAEPPRPSGARPRRRRPRPRRGGCLRSGPSSRRSGWPPESSWTPARSSCWSARCSSTVYKPSSRISSASSWSIARASSWSGPTRWPCSTRPPPRTCAARGAAARRPSSSAGAHRRRASRATPEATEVVRL